jgi:hypothetical protein
VGTEQAAQCNNASLTRSTVHGSLTRSTVASAVIHSACLEIARTSTCKTCKGPGKKQQAQHAVKNHGGKNDRRDLIPCVDGDRGVAIADHRQFGRHQ